MKVSNRANNWLDGDTTLLFFLTLAGSHQLNGSARVQLLPPLPRKSNGQLGLLPPNLSGVPCNFSFLTSCYKYRGFDQRFIRIQLLYTYLHSLIVKCFDSNAQHQSVTRPAPLSGLHPLSDQPDAEGRFLHRYSSLAGHTQCIGKIRAGPGNNEHLIAH